jgi:NitT/TauT family transport system substrate-binding protein
MRTKLTRRAALTVTAAGLAVRPTGAQTLQTIIVGGVTSDDLCPLWYAMDSGLFRRAGIAIDNQKVASGSASTLGVVTGNYNIADTNALSAILGVARGVPITVIITAGMYDGAPDWVGAIAKKDSPLQTAADLNGKVVGTTGARDINGMAFSNWVDTHGGDSKQLRILEVPYTAIAPAVEEGRVDIGLLLQPFLAASLTRPGIRLFADPFQGFGRTATSVWIANKPWHDANQEVVRRFVRVMREASAYANSHRSETAALLAQRTGGDVETIRKGGRETFNNEFAQPRDLQPIVDLALKYGVLDKRVDPTDVISPLVRGLR